MEGGLIQSLHKRTSTICQENTKICVMKLVASNVIFMKGYPCGFIDSVINWKSGSLLSKEVKPLVSVYIPHVKGVSEKCKCIRNLYNVRVIFRTKHTLRSSVMKTRPER
jgi:hypothetical protein